MEHTEKMLHVRNLKVMFVSPRGMIKAVEGIDLDVHKGECVALVGESGCGKSVTSLTIMGLRNEAPCAWQSDELTLNIAGKDVELRGLEENKMQGIRGKYMSMVFQDPMTCLNPVMTVGSQIDEVFIRHQLASLKEEVEQTKKRIEELKAQGKPEEAKKIVRLSVKSAAKARSIEALKVVNVPSPEKRYRDYPHQLSGGMRQRVMIAIAYACRPNFMIADEPTTALDVTVQAQVLDLMKGLQKCNNTGLLLITHDLSVVANMADVIYVMYAGKIVERAKCDELFENPLHPYTIGLIASVPKMEGKHKKFIQIPDSVPHPTMKPTGCYFHPRCKFATEKCKTYMPVLEKVDGSDREIRCWNWKNLEIPEEK